MKHSLVRSHKFTRFTTRLFGIALFAALFFAAPLQPAFAQNAPSLGAAEGFAILGGPAVTLTDSTVDGDVGSGLSGSTVIQTNSTISGTVHEGDEAAIAAYNDFLSAYDEVAQEECGESMSGTLDGVTLSPGVYCFDAAATLTGQLTLDGPADGVWIFKIGTLGTGALTGTNFSVVMSGGGQACNVYWWVAEASTMTDSDFQGTILAGAASTFTRGSLIGRDFAKAGVTFTGVTVSGCESGTPPEPPVVCKDIVKGKGWIKLAAGRIGEFSITGWSKEDEFWANLIYADWGFKPFKCAAFKNKMIVKSTGVTDYTVVDEITRHIEGTAEINGKAGFTYQVDVVDNGRFGRGDTFSLQLSNGYTASGYLAGGNIKIYEKCNPPIGHLPCNHDKNKHDHGKDCKGHK